MIMMQVKGDAACTSFEPSVLVASVSSTASVATAAVVVVAGAAATAPAPPPAPAAPVLSAVVAMLVVLCVCSSGCWGILLKYVSVQCLNAEITPTKHGNIDKLYSYECFDVYNHSHSLYTPLPPTMHWYS